MTKISFDLDFSKDSETLLKEIQDKAKSEVEKRETKERANSYLADLHQKVNEEIGTSYKSATDLIRALSEHASPLMRERISGSSPTGRRKTVSMTRELYQQIKDQLDKPSPNKAAIAREIGVSVVQVRKVAAGGFEDKFSDSALPEESQTPIEEAEEISVNIEGSKVDGPDPIVGSEIDTEDEIATSPEPLVEELPETGFAEDESDDVEESPPIPKPPSADADLATENEPFRATLPPILTSGAKSGSGGLPKGKFSAKITRPPMAPGSLPPPPPPES